jgi:hypothetical protein
MLNVRTDGRCRRDGRGVERRAMLERGTEVAFWGADGGAEKVRDVELTEQFARSMALAAARGRRP